MYQQKALETFQSLVKFCNKLQPDHLLHSAKYQCAMHNKLARIYCECLCIRKAHEFSELATVLAKMEKQAKLTQFKYRIAHCLTKRRLGDYLEALKDLDVLFDEIIEEQKKTEAGSKKWIKL